MPWQPATAHRQITMMRDQLEETPEMATGEQALNLVLTMLENMACPHTDCPRMLLDHEH